MRADGGGSDEARRWLFVWGELRGTGSNYPDAVRDEKIEGSWPRADHATGDLDAWRGHIGDVLRRAMCMQRPWPFERFRASYLDHPVAAPLVAGLVFALDDGTPFVFDAGRAPELAWDTLIRVAHPAEGTDAWPASPAPPIFDQAGHPTFDAHPLPPIPERPIPHREWKRRGRALRLLAHVEGGGGVRKEHALLDPWRLTIEHAGYGAGYGGARAIEGIRVTMRRGTEVVARLAPGEATGWAELPRWLRSETIRMLQLLFEA